MKRLRSYGEDLDDVAGKEWERREIEPDRSSSRRRFYMKSESLRRSSSSLYDRSIDDDREAMRPPRKRFEHELDGFDRRKIFDRYRDGGGGGGVDRTPHVSSPRGSYGSERLHRSESFSAIRRDFPKGFRSERDRSRREVCGGLSWRRLNCGKEAADEEKRSPARDSEDRGKTRSMDSSSGEQAKDVEAVKADMDKVRRESCSSSEMEEGELEPDPLPEPSIHSRGQAERDSQNIKDKDGVIETVSEASSENKGVQLSMKRSDNVDGTSDGERSMEIEQIQIAKKLNEEIIVEGEGFVELRGQRESLSESQGEAKDLAEDTCEEGKLEDTSCGEKKDLAEACEEEKLEETSCSEKKERINYESSYLPSQFPNLEINNKLEKPVVKDDELRNVYTASRQGNLEEIVREGHFSEVEMDIEKKDETCINLGVVQRKEKGIDQVDFEAEQRKGKGIDLQVATVGEAGHCNSVKEIKCENNLTLKPMAENPRDKGKRIARPFSNMADSAEDEDAVEGPSRRGFELVFQDHIIQPDKANSCGLFGGRIKKEKLKLEPLDLSLGLPGVLTDHSSKPPNSNPNSPGGTRSIQSFPSSFRTISDGFTNSMSLSSSQPFVHNPSCSLTQNSMDNFEQSVGSRPVFHGADQVSSGTIRQSHTSIEPKRKGGAGALFHRVLLNGNHSQNSIPGMNGHHNLNSNALLRQQSFPRQPSPPQSVGSHDTLSEHSKDKRMLTRERSFNSLSRTEQREGDQIVVNAPSFVERIITRIVSEPLQVMERMLQDMSEHSMEYLKDSICKMLANTDKRGQIHALQGTLQGRADLISETMTRCPQTLLEILVALKTGLPDFIQRPNNVSSSDLVEIYHKLRCRNIACRNILPVDDCDCKICSQKNGFCSACMCLVCSKFDMASNTCSWVGCDVCLHWCHTDCGLRGSHIRNGRSSSVALGATEMQFHCVACGHPSEMFGFVKEVFKMCSKDWKVENLAKELQYVRRIFCASNDMRGKSLYQVAGQMLVKLEDKKKHSEVIKNIMSFLSESESTINNSPLYSPSEPSGNNDQRGNAVAFPIEETAWLTPLPSSQVSRILHKSASPTVDDDQMCRQRKDSSILQMSFEKKPVVDELESVVEYKQAEANLYQERADNARREADGLKRIAAAKTGKIDDEYSTKMARLQLQEAEEKRRQKLEELQAMERAHHDFINLKARMEAEIKDLLLKMEDTRRNFNA
ncbi:hypothetical protein KFK09_027379 [Dendrobium nobile]|uniref:Protein OBERON 4 n=1 Tax=Dendrobium nobile TaxID=94219 RepID=A0A8T3AAJ8_DENNO|nr:hypothetical protein KFK09_027379 [Dendrobium nobile]